MIVINTYIIFVCLLLVMLAAMAKYIISNNIHKYFYVTGNENNRNFQERYISNFVKRLVDISWREV